MLKIIFNGLIKVTIAFLILALNINAQESVEQRRQREHQEVLNLLNYKLSNSPISTNKNKTLKYSEGSLQKITGDEDRKPYFMNGNNVAVEIENYGGIAPGFGSIREITNLVWRDAPYIFQFCPIVGGSVVTETGERIHIISDGMNDYDFAGLREIDPATGLKWQWQPLSGYADPNQPYIASNPAFDANRDGKPDSWPREWYNSTLGEYVWPGYLVQGENNADLEAFWAMDDRDNREFKYYPFPNDTLRRGLGIQIDGRAFQWSNSLAANAIFFVWSITNVSEKNLDTLLFGIYGDPDIGYFGRGTSEPSDDNGFFISPFDTTVPLYSRNMVYFWDPDGIGDLGLPLGYLGCKFLESPGNPNDGIDNDGDGIIDERQDDDLDNDGDWNIETDDVGVDGIPNTGDFGEGDGLPTRGSRLADGRPDPLSPGEPNFEYTDLDESDQIGLTSFQSSAWNSDLKIALDENIWNRCKPGSFSTITQDEDIVFIFGSGYISLAPGETKRISMSFLFGENLNDLLVTAETVQDIYNKNYRFFKPPTLPKVAAVPEDKKVTLYWDASSEESVDPITGKDFEGYVIYRSTRPDFADIQVITDGHASSFLYEPLRDLAGFEAKFDLNNEWRGYHPVAYQGRGLHYYLGDNTGLIHSFVDSNNVINGQTYYYAVVAYDHGDSLGIPPSETTKKITVDPITGQTIFDDNTVMVIPGPRASGYNEPEISNIDIQQTNGTGNGDVDFQILNDLEIKDETYTLTFSDSLVVGDSLVAGKNYSIRGEKSVTESFFLFDTKFANLSKQFIINDETIEVKDNNGVIYQKDVDYIIDYNQGKIRRDSSSTMPNNSEFIITYHYYSVYQSQALHNEDSNPVFDGILLKVTDYNILEYDPENSSWIGGDVEISFSAQLSTIGAANRKVLYPADYDITFSDQNEFTAIKNVTGTGFINIPVNFKVEDVTSGVPQPIIVFLNEKEKNDSAFTRGDGIILFKPGSSGVNTDTLTWEITISKVTAGDSVYPGSGDVLRISTKRPFNKQDVFSLETNAGEINQQAGASLLDNIYVVPNPYVGTSVLEPDNKLPSQNRGERRIYFENLPMECTIRVYTLSGELVTTLEHNEGVDNGREYWNLLNRDGFSVAYGIYIAHIEAPNIGEKLIKFALIK